MLDSIVENRIPIVVHNGVLDLMHVILCVKKDIPEILLKIPSDLAGFLPKTSLCFPLHLRHQIHLQQLPCYLPDLGKINQPLKLLS